MSETLLEEIRRAMTEADCLATKDEVATAYDRLAADITGRLIADTSNNGSPQARPRH